MLTLPNKLFAILKPIPLARRSDVSRRAAILSFGARFADELLSGLPDVLMPTIRTQLGLSLTQVSLLGLTLNYVATGVELVNGLLIDMWQRRWLMAWGAAGIALAIITMGLAPTFIMLLLGYAIYGLASGPLAHTADVVLIEAYPDAPDCIYARATLVDTLGALLAPLLVSFAILAGVEWRMLLLLVGAAGLAYAVLIVRTTFPAPGRAEDGHQPGFWSDLRQNIRAVLVSRRVLSWLLFLFLFDIFEASAIFQTIWLYEDVGMSQALIGFYKAIELGVGVVSLLVLDRWLDRAGFRRVLLLASAGLLLLVPAWLLLPGIWSRFLIAIPLNFLAAVFWPIGRGQSLASVPGKAGTITAVSSLFGAIPLPLLFGLLAEAITLTAAMLWVSLGALLLLLLLVLMAPLTAEQNTQK
jgi:MFS family permease